MSEDIPSAPGGFAPGSQIAGYRLLEQIGQGGMAVVFRSHDERLDRQVALKILAPGLALDDAFRQRFMRESRAAAAVDDPHIIPVFEAGEARGVLFIAMRYVRGGDVRTLLDREGPLPPARATEIISQVAQALDDAHAHGLVHRDVKPANMLLDPGASRDRPDHVYLSDFGLSKQSLAPSGLTSSGQFLGTLDYVAPEQIEGRPVDGRADQYALGCAAFELLSGAPPFSRDQSLAVIYAQLSEPPPALSARQPGTPPAVDQAVARALAKSPADRFATCREFAAALRDGFGLRPLDSGPEPIPALDRPATQLAMPAAGTGPAAGPRAAGSGQAGLPAAGREHAGPGSAPPGHAGAGSAGSGHAGSGSAGPARAGPGSAWPETAAGSGAGIEAAAEPGRPAEPRPPAGQQPAEPRLPAGRPPAGRPLAGQPTQAAAAPGAGRTPPGATDPRYGQPAAGGRPDYGQPTGPRHRPRKVAAAAAAAAAVLVVGGGAFLLLGHGSGGGSGAPVTSLPVPGCTTKTATTHVLSAVRPASVPVGGNPFAVQVSRGGQFSFVSTGGNSVAMLNNNGGGQGLTLARDIQALGAHKGEAITGNGYLLVAGQSGAVVISIKEAEQGVADPVVGDLTSPSGTGAVEVALSPDDNFAFVTLQSSAEMAVFNLKAAEASGFRQSGFVGFVPLGSQPVGIAQHGSLLYVTSMQRLGRQAPSEGTVSVVSLARAETKPSTAVLSTATAGCAPSRVMTTPNGSVVWVTTQQSNALLAFNAARLLTDPGHSLIAKVLVGQNPIGEIFIKGGTQIVVANSDNSDPAGPASSLMVVNTQDALAGKGALVGTIRTGRQPRQFDTEGGKTLLVTNTNSGQVQAVSIGDIP